MKEPMTFDELDQLDTDHLQAMLAGGRLSDENRRRIAYEIRIRNMEVPELNMKLKNQYTI